MAKCRRHFGALMRKNFILWFRTPGCAFFEIAAPVALMLVLAVIRNTVPRISEDQTGMLAKKTPSFPGVGYENGYWQNSTAGDTWLNNHVRPFFNYSDYIDDHNKKEETGTYDVGYDKKGPQFYAPSHCLKTFDWNRPKRSSPIIAIIGTETNLTSSIGNYMFGIRKTQHATLAAFATPLYKA